MCHYKGYETTQKQNQITTTNIIYIRNFLKKKHIVTTSEQRQKIQIQK